jgi:hypothetical protein
MKKIGIIGTRRRDSSEASKKIKEAFFKVYKEGDIIVSGGCPKGGDRFAERIAKDNGIPILIYYPNWKLGRGAGLIRNSEIAKDSDILIACVSKDRTGGSEDTIKKYLETGKAELYLV